MINKPLYGGIKIDSSAKVNLNKADMIVNFNPELKLNPNDNII